MLSPLTAPSEALRGLSDGFQGPVFFQGAALAKLLKNPLYTLNFAINKTATSPLNVWAASKPIKPYLTKGGELVY